MEPYMELPVSKLVSNGLNPRKDFGDLSELEASIKAHGLLEPLIIRPSADGAYEIIAGHRRMKAIKNLIKAKHIKKDTAFPCVLREADDAVAQELMLIENIQRKDLSEVEQAEAFKKYLDEHGGECEVLAEKTGLTQYYIRRRAKAFDLPKEIVAMWKADEISFGHIQQLLRLDAEQIGDLLALVDNEDEKPGDVLREMTVEDLGDYISRELRVLKNAPFDIKAAGCGQCAQNSATQVALFGDDYAIDKVSCLNAKCFSLKMSEHFEKNWPQTKFAKKFKTNGFMFYKNYSDCDGIYRDVHANCEDCKDFVTVFRADGGIYYERGCKNPSCHGKTYKTASSSSSPGSYRDMKPEEKAAHRSEQHATLFTENFYAAELQKKFIEASADDVRVLRTLAFAFIKHDSRAALGALGLPPEEARKNYDHMQKIDSLATAVLTMEATEVKELLAKLSVHALLDQRNFNIVDRYTVARQFDIVLGRDWRITEDYLLKKRKDELLALMTELGIRPYGDSNPKRTSLVSHMLRELKDRTLPAIPTEIIAKETALEAEVITVGADTENTEEGGDEE